MRLFTKDVRRFTQRIFFNQVQDGKEIKRGSSCSMSQIELNTEEQKKKGNQC